jgi:diguanylate cyclase (GGDEF)-like protein/PAS domain S-box-containing protein
MIDLGNAVFRSVIDAAPEGVVICTANGADNPVVYLNAAFERLTGYAAAELLGTDLRRLQGSDREQEGRNRLRQALDQGTGTRALLRNYRKDGSQFWNELFLEPVRDAGGAVTHFVAFHRDVGERERSAGAREPAGLPAWMRQDRLTSLYSRAYFEELLRHDWQVAKREERLLTVMLFGIDALEAYVERFGRQAGDACIRRLAGVVNAGFRRGSDLVARWEGGALIALVRSTGPSALEGFAQMITQRVLEQCIHHPRPPGGKYVTVSVGVASLMPTVKQQPEALLRGATRALERAQDGPGGRVVLAGSKDFA